MVRALQKGDRLDVSEKVRTMAKRINPTDVGHFAETKHKGLPETKAAGAQGRFMAQLRDFQAGKRPLSEASEQMLKAVKTSTPKDPDGRTMPFAKASMIALWFCKGANLEGALKKTEQAIGEISKKRQEALKAQKDQLQQENEKLKAELQKGQQNSAEMEAVINAQPPDQPSAQPAYGAQLAMNQQQEEDKPKPVKPNLLPGQPRQF
jgi:hypothetical protein